MFDKPTHLSEYVKIFIKVYFIANRQFNKIILRLNKSQVNDAREDALKLRGPPVLPRTPSFPDTHKLLKNLNLAGMLLDF